jgi:hypothetical protein
MSQLSIALCGGLGNQLFQIAAAHSISKKTNRVLLLGESPVTHHSRQDYYSSIFSKWVSCRKDIKDAETINEKSYEYEEWQFPLNKNVILSGYFQNYKYILDDFIDSLVLPNVPTLQGAFIHIRGGDYVNHWLHDVKLQSYYEKSIACFPKHTKFYIFTNDISYAKTFPFLDTIDYEFVNESDELHSLALMKHCLVGGICPNSTFSWWAAYMNRKDRILVLPSKWFNSPYIYIDGYFFPGSTVITV